MDRYSGVDAVLRGPHWYNDEAEPAPPLAASLCLDASTSDAIERILSHSGTAYLLP